MTLQEQVAAARARLLRAGVPAGEATFDAELLARHLLSWDRATYFSRRAEPAPAQFLPGFDALVGRRERREPMSHLIGTREFWGFDFEVSPAVLTPRPETELLLEEALSWSARHDPVRIVDVGTGSGCLAVSLARVCAGYRVVAVDISMAALAVARRNAARHDVSSRIAFVQSSLLSSLTGGLDLILANLPYVPEGDRASLSPEVRDYEPAAALFGGPDGLDPIRALVRESAELLSPGGALIAEFGVSQEQELRRIVATAHSLSVRRIRADLQGIPRVAVIARPETD